MLKIIVFLLSLLVVGFLIVHDNWMITISGFGYEATVSTVFLVCFVLLIFYLLHLLKKPLVWLGVMHHKMNTARFIKRENYLTDVLRYVLDQNNTSLSLLLRQKRSMFDKNDVKTLLSEAVLAPDKDVFEALAKQPLFELAGYRGLYQEALKTGDIKAQEKALTQAFEKYSSVSWVVAGLYSLSLQKNEWDSALTYLDNLKKNTFINKETYYARKADLLMKLDRPMEAFRLNPANVCFAVAAAGKNPQKAADILIKAWSFTSAREIYKAYMNLFASETAVKQMKALKKLIADNPTSRFALLATADTAIRLELWKEAKETLQVYLATYPLTKTVAGLMATVVREGWHHEEEAKEWESKTKETEDTVGWFCISCQQRTTKWDIACPHCNAVHQIIYG